MKKTLTSILSLTAYAAFAEAELNDAYMIAESRLKPLPAWLPWLCVLAAIVLLALVALAVILYRRKHAKRTAPLPTPYQVATAALQALLAEGLPEKGEAKLFHQRLSSILREYLEARFDVSAPRLTTEEFMALLTKTPALVQEHRRLLQEFLNACDMVKFAGVSSGQTEMAALATSCRTFLENTHEEPVQETAK